MKKTTTNSHNVWKGLKTALLDASDDQLDLAGTLIRREKWIRHWYKVYQNSNGSAKYYGGGYTVVTILPKYLTRAPRCGWSTCRLAEDDFDQKIGIAVATARAFGEKIPDYI